MNLFVRAYIFLGDLFLKNEIAYFYHLYPTSIVAKMQTYSFEYQSKKYKFCPYTRNLNEVEALFTLNQALTQQNYFFPKMILNVRQQILTDVNGKYYLLIEERLPIKQLNFKEVAYPLNYSFPQDKIMSLKRNNWSYLWQIKIDYFEYQREHIDKKFPFLMEGLDYFLGLAENAISYLNTIDKMCSKTNQDILTFTRRRVSVNDTLSEFYNPLNFVIDYKVRDISEFIKSCFFETDISVNQLKQWVLELKLSSYSCGLLLARLLFPTYYFDLYEQIVNGVKKEKEIEKVIRKIEDYIKFLIDIQEILQTKNQIPPIINIQTL